MSSLPPEGGNRESGDPENAPSKPSAFRRPRWLVLALVSALILGAGCWTEGCNRLSLYRGDREQRASLNAEIHDEADRARVDGLFERFLDAADTRRSPGVPLAAATFVLGAALLAFAGRGIAGRGGSRNALVQVVAARAIVVAVSWFALKEVREAENDWQIECTLAQHKDAVPPGKYEETATAFRTVVHAAQPSWLVFRTLASFLIVFALTRPRSREFFESAEQVPEP